MTDAITEQNQDKIDAAVSAGGRQGLTVDSIAVGAAYVAGEDSGDTVPDCGTIVPETILEEAARITAGPRQATYGHPLDDYTRTAAIWSAILGTEVTAEQAVLCMIAVKMSRLSHEIGRDSIVDLAGYARCLERMRAKRGEEGYAP